MPTITSTLRRRAGAVRRRAREATSMLRPLPDFLIVGAQKAGTTSLFAYLAKGPAVVPPLAKELHFFDIQFERGESWYRSRFPTQHELTLAGRRAGHRAITGEGSPYYLFHPEVPRRVRSMLPDAKLIVLLRDPVARAVSHHNHESVLGYESLTFAEAVHREVDRLAVDAHRPDSELAGPPTHVRHHSYLARGRYAEQLERWFAHFPREQFLIMSAEELFADPEATLARTCDFLGIPPHRLERYDAELSRRYDDIDPHLRAELSAYFAPYNQRLYELLGVDFGW